MHEILDNIINSIFDLRYLLDKIPQAEKERPNLKEIFLQTHDLYTSAYLLRRDIQQLRDYPELQSSSEEEEENWKLRQKFFPHTE